MSRAMRRSVLVSLAAAVLSATAAGSMRAQQPLRRHPSKRFAFSAMSTRSSVPAET
jgi:hypothetical protein